MQRNAWLRSVAGSGGTDLWEQGAAPASEWTGRHPAYYDERRDRVVGQQGADLIVWRSLILHGGLPASIDEGDTLTFDVDGLADGLTGTVKAIEFARLRTMPQDLQTTRVTLQTT